jgi:hypothetical protein
MIHGPPLALATVLHLTLPPDPTPKHTPVQIAPKQLKLLRLSVKKRYHSQKQLTGTATNHPKQPPSKNCFSANFISKSNNSQTTHTPQTPKHWCQAPNFRQFLVPGTRFLPLPAPNLVPGTFSWLKNARPSLEILIKQASFWQ